MSAIRCIRTRTDSVQMCSRIAREKAPSAIRCIKTCEAGCCRWDPGNGEKAPSAIRRIKTQSQPCSVPCNPGARKHRALKGALRLHEVLVLVEVEIKVRKHRAPKGALRQASHDDLRESYLALSESTERQEVH